MAESFKKEDRVNQSKEYSEVNIQREKGVYRGTFKCIYMLSIKSIIYISVCVCLLSKVSFNHILQRVSFNHMWGLSRTCWMEERDRDRVVDVRLSWFGDEVRECDLVVGRGERFCAFALCPDRWTDQRKLM